MSEERSSPPEIIDAIVALHAFTESGFHTLAKRIDGMDTKIDLLRHDMNRRFDDVDERFDRWEGDRAF